MKRTFYLSPKPLAVLALIGAEPTRTLSLGYGVIYDVIGGDADEVDEGGLGKLSKATKSFGSEFICSLD